MRTRHQTAPLGVIVREGRHRDVDAQMHPGEDAMYRKTLIALVAVTTLAVAVPLDASVARGHGGGHGGGRGGGGSHGGGSHGASLGRGFSASGMRAGVGSFRTAGVRNLSGNWRAAGRQFRHHRHHRRFFVVTAAPYYYYDDGCYQLQQVPTRWGWRWQRVWLCY